jgi:hypothetical protein
MTDDDDYRAERTLLGILYRAPTTFPAYTDESLKTAAMSD